MFFDHLAQHRVHRRQQAFGIEAGDGGRDAVLLRHELPFLRPHHGGDVARRHQGVEAGRCRCPAAGPPRARSGARTTGWTGWAAGPLRPLAIRPATGAVVVSKPAAKNTTSLSGWARRWPALLPATKRAGRHHRRPWPAPVIGVQPWARCREPAACRRKRPPMTSSRRAS